LGSKTFELPWSIWYDPGQEQKLSNVKAEVPNPVLGGFPESISRVLIPRSQSGTTIHDAYRPYNRNSIATPADLGEFIKSVRKSKGLTQQQFADLSGVGRRFIVECEAGKPRLEFAKVLQVAAAAGIDIIAQKR
jgi:y4mF family transcriptional regulator